MTARSENRWQRQNRAYFDKPFGLAHPDAHPSVEQAVLQYPTKAQVKHWMWCYFDDYIDGRGELQTTQLVEAYAISHPEAYPWLDDRTHWIWDIPIDIAQQMGC